MKRKVQNHIIHSNIKESRESRHSKSNFDWEFSTKPSFKCKYVALADPPTYLYMILHDFNGACDTRFTSFQTLNSDKWTGEFTFFENSFDVNVVKCKQNSSFCTQSNISQIGYMHTKRMRYLDTKIKKEFLFVYM